MTQRAGACQHCDWWDAFPGGTRGACHRYPPVYSKDEEYAKSPVTYAVDWCAEWEEAIEEPE